MTQSEKQAEQKVILLSNSMNSDLDWDNKHDPNAKLYLDSNPSWQPKKYLKEIDSSKLNKAPLLQIGKAATPRMVWMVATERGIIPSEALLNIAV